MKPPADLGDRGLKLWNDLLAAGSFDAGGIVLAEEACRLADRLERMAILIADGDDDLMQEARQSQMTLKHVLNELRQIQKLKMKVDAGGASGAPSGLAAIAAAVKAKGGSTP